MIPKADCKHGYTYRIKSRNLVAGVYREPTGGFVGIREKFGNRFLFEEFHWENPQYATVQPQREIEKCPVEDLRAYLESRCQNCERPVAWHETDPKNSTGVWYHTEHAKIDGLTVVDHSGCPKARSYAPHNDVLFEYMQGIEKRVEREIVIEDLEALIKADAQSRIRDYELRWSLIRALRAGVATVEDIGRDLKVAQYFVDQWRTELAVPDEYRRPLCEYLLKRARESA